MNKKKKETYQYKQYHQYGFFDYDPKSGDVDPYIKKRIEEENKVLQELKKGNGESNKPDPDIPF